MGKRRWRSGWPLAGLALVLALTAAALALESLAGLGGVEEGELPSGGIPTSRETIFVVGASASMRGDPIVLARLTLLDALDRLGEGDQFNLVVFGNRRRKLFRRSRGGGPWAVDLAREWVHGLEAGGSSEMLPAVEEVLGRVEDPSFPRRVILLTDGAVADEAELFAYVAGNLGSSRLFVVSIGAAPNTHFLRRTAELGRGTLTTIALSSEVEDRMDELFRDLEAPALTDLEIDNPPA